MRRGPYIADRRVAAGLGVALLLAGWMALADAYTRRGYRPPLVLRPFVWWR